MKSEYVFVSNDIYYYGYYIVVLQYKLFNIILNHIKKSDKPESNQRPMEIFNLVCK